MFDLSKHPLFSPWRDPQSGVESFILTHRLAPIQQSLYFTSRGVTPDERWMWFTCAYPPSPHKTLALVCLDPANPIIRHFPNSQVTTALPMVCADNTVLFGADSSIYRIDLEGRTTKLFTLPSTYAAGRKVTRLATHLTRSADGRKLLLDGAVGNHWFVATADLADGTFKLIKEFAHNFNHAQFSTVDPESFLIAQDWFHDAVTGRRFHYDNRIWLMRTDDSRFLSITPDVYCKHMTGVSHEWWSADGRICYVEYDSGAYETLIPSGRDVRAADVQHTHVWKEPLCHAHCDRSRAWWCADESPYKWKTQPCKVLFLNRQTQRVTAIASALPEPEGERGTYHIDPHPQFSPNDSWITYTTTALGRVDVALCPTAPLRAR